MYASTYTVFGIYTSNYIPTKIHLKKLPLFYVEHFLDWFSRIHLIH